MKTILITGIGGLTPRSIATVIRKNHPDYKLIGCDIDKKAMGFFMNGLVDDPYCFLVERLGHVRCIRFKSDIARESKYEESGGKAI